MSASMKCRVCGKMTKKQFAQEIMNGKHTVDYYLCPHCEFMQVEDPYWLDEAYNSAINLSDTGILLRNINFANYVTAIIWSLLDETGCYLDFAGGYGIFTRLMRDIGFDYYWKDIYTQNLVARGFEYQESLGKVRMLTAFETFEHFVVPMEEMQGMLKLSDNIVFSTQLLPIPTPAPGKWWYYGLEHGQHTAFYRPKTMQFIAGEFGLEFYTNGGDFHMFTKEKLVPRLLNNDLLGKMNMGHSHTDRTVITQSYQALKTSSSGKRVERAARLIYQLVKMGKFVELKPSAAREVLSKLVSTEFRENYFRYLLQNAVFIRQNIVQPRMRGRAFSDMEYMSQFMHKE